MDELARSYLFDYTNNGYNENPEDHKKLLDILNKGVRLNFPACMSQLAFIYRNCASVVGLKKDVNIAVKWYKRAAELNNKEVIMALGAIYYYGEGPISAKEHLSEEEFNSYMSSRDSRTQSGETTAPSVSAPAVDTEEGKLNYERALPFCREDASHWDLIRGLSYIISAKNAGCAAAGALYDDVISRIRAKYDKFMAEGRPDFRLLAQLQYAPLFQNHIPAEFRQQAFDHEEAH